jgi:hypothetical protein
VKPDRAAPEIELLNVFGQVSPPASGALENARQALWSAVADEVLRSGQAGARKTGRETSQPPQTARRHQRDRPQQTEQRRRAGPGS